LNDPVNNTDPSGLIVPQLTEKSLQNWSPLSSSSEEGSYLSR
jgi:hypothetical protein